MIKIICLGKIKEQYLKEAISDYQKRITRYAKLEIIELEDETNYDEKTILSKEKDKINKIINDKDYIITLEIEGSSLSSIQLAHKLENVMNSSSNITFIIGSSYGIHESIKEKAKFHLSFSKLTFPHQLFRVLLLEQIYRSFKIINNETYHK